MTGWVKPDGRVLCLSCSGCEGARAARWSGPSASESRGTMTGVPARV
jgi:hypothetical protein